MHDPAVAVTDFLLSLECVWLAFSVGKRPASRRLFGTLAVSSFLGGVVHGFFPDESTLEYLVLWRSTLVVLGLVAVSCWSLNVKLVANEKWRKAAWFLIGLSFACYLPFVVRGDPAFAIGVAYYAPSVLFLLGAFLWRYDRTNLPGVVGLLLTFVAAGIQQSGLDLHRYLDHNTLYHLVQGLGIYLLYRTLSVVEVPAS